MNEPIVAANPSQKITALVLVLACVVIGLFGLVLPIIPGLLFLAIAAFIAAKHFPSVDARLRAHRAIDKHLNNADRFRNLSLPAKVQIAGWLCLKMMVDGLVLVRSFLAKLGAALQ
jgi:uncharacterized membrane protein YbaN (DUF454 family)